MEREINSHEREPVMDHCGIIAIYSRDGTNGFTRAYAGLSKIQTRGYDGAGVCAIDEKGVVATYGEGRISKAFDEEVFSEFKERDAKVWLMQTRYGTNGSSKPENLQPLVRRTKSGEEFSVITNGEYYYPDSVDGSSDTVQFVNELSNMKGDWDSKILSIQNSKKGAWSTIVATEGAMYLMRDSHGIRPFVFGAVMDPETGCETIYAGSETAALAAMGVNEFIEVMPGSVVKVSECGVELLQAQDTESLRAPCGFENAYVANGKSVIHRSRVDPDEINSEPTIGSFRRKTGELLGRRETREFVRNVDFVVGIPGTGIEGGRAYAQAAGLPYIQAFVDRKPAEIDERTFMQTDIQVKSEDEIARKIEGHFYIDGTVLFGAKVVFVDDSVVRGNISKNLTALMKKPVEEGGYGVSEIHMRVLFPPVDKTCHLGISTRKEKELLAAKYVDREKLEAGGLTEEIWNEVVEKMRVEIGADSLKFVTAEDMYEAAGTNQLCLGCTIGQVYPT